MLDALRLVIDVDQSKGMGKMEGVEGYGKEGRGVKGEKVKVSIARKAIKVNHT